MAREIKTTEEIRACIQAMIDESHLDELCNVRCVPLPNRLPAPDSRGCNWTIAPPFSCPPECMTSVEGFVARAQQLYNLK